MGLWFKFKPTVMKVIHQVSHTYCYLNKTTRKHCVVTPPTEIKVSIQLIEMSFKHARPEVTRLKMLFGHS